MYPFIFPWCFHWSILNLKLNGPLETLPGQSWRQVQKQLGKGSFGTVYLVSHRPGTEDAVLQSVIFLILPMLPMALILLIWAH